MRDSLLQKLTLLSVSASLYNFCIVIAKTTFDISLLIKVWHMGELWNIQSILLNIQKFIPARWSIKLCVCSHEIQNICTKFRETHSRKPTILTLEITEDWKLQDLKLLLKTKQVQFPFIAIFYICCKMAAGAEENREYQTFWFSIFIAINTF